MASTINTAADAGTPHWLVFHLDKDQDPIQTMLLPQPSAPGLETLPDSFHRLVCGLFRAVEQFCDVKSCTGHFVAECLTDDSTDYLPPAKSRQPRNTRSSRKPKPRLRKYGP